MLAGTAVINSTSIFALPLYGKHCANTGVQWGTKEKVLSPENLQVRGAERCQTGKATSQELNCYCFWECKQEEERGLGLGKPGKARRLEVPSPVGVVRWVSGRADRDTHTRTRLSLCLETLAEGQRAEPWRMTWQPAKGWQRPDPTKRLDRTLSCALWVATEGRKQASNRIQLVL